MNYTESMPSKDFKISSGIIAKIPARFANHYKIIPVKFEDGIITIAMENPLDLAILDEVCLLTGFNIEGMAADPSDIKAAIERHYGLGAETIEKIISARDIDKNLLTKKLNLSNIDDLGQDASIIKFVNQLLAQAVKDGATDIHIEPYESELKVRYRLDGVLYDVPVPRDIAHFKSAIVSRLKIMAELDISERRLAQDGRIKIKVAGAEIDLRISILPTQFGESVNIRILAQSMFYTLSNLGLSSFDLETLERLIKKPHGIIFVTGPTGSGKTTTLYACLSRINKSDCKIITIEDPIEYQIKGVTQMQVYPRIGFTFAAGLRSMLRHDPDIMMIGEVRDFETAEITIRVALTGHLVFSTLHTNDAIGGITRLLDIGIEPYLVASSVECFIAQRLVRVICPSCKVMIEPGRNVLEEFWQNNEINKSPVYQGKGCEACKFTGYRGRTAIYEFLVMNDSMRDMVIRKAPASQIKKEASGFGFHSLRMDGWQKIVDGVTTLSEVMRVTQEE